MYAFYLFHSYNNPIDFMVFWTAGQIWAEEGNPYGLGFGDQLKETLDTDIQHFWLYSPQVWLLSRPISTLEFEAAFSIWFWVSFTFYYAGVCLLAFTVLDLSRGLGYVLTVVLLCLTLGSSAAAGSLTIGQFSAFTFFGLSAFAHAVLTRNEATMTIGLLLLTMKASVGLGFVAFGLASPALRRATIIALAVIALAALPALSVGGILPFVNGYLDGVSAYGSVASNAPPATTGLRHLVYGFTGYEISGVVLALATAAIAICAALVAPPRRALAIALTAMLFLVPLHIYDLAAVTLVLAGVVRFGFGVLVVASVFVLFRVSSVEGLLPISGFEGIGSGNFVASVVLGLLFAGASIQATLANDPWE